MALGAGVWSTHFVAMLAHKSSLPVGYDVPLTGLSIALAMILGGAGLWVWLNGQRIIAGIVIAMSVGAMHFVGMAALRGPIQIDWDLSLVGAAWVVGIAMAVAATLASAQGSRRTGRYLVTGLLTLTICTLHFTAMAAVTYSYDPFASSGGLVLDGDSLAVAIAPVSSLVITTGFALAYVDAFVDRRKYAEARRLKQYVLELEQTRDELNRKTEALEGAFQQADSHSKAKSDFLAVMSHELRTPLNAIIGFSELMQMEPKGPLGHSSYRQYTADILNSGQQLLELVNGVLDYSKIEAGEMELEDEQIDLDDLIRDCCRMMQPRVEAASLQLVADVESDLPMLRADRAKVRRIVLNLVSNALKFTPAGRVVTISATCSEGCIQLDVTDTGIGMKPGEIQRAMEVFGQVESSLNRKHEGTGLGLPICIRLAQLHGGRLDLQSEYGVGTVATVHFPLRRTVARTGPDQPELAVAS